MDSKSSLATSEFRPMHRTLLVVSAVAPQLAGLARAADSLVNAGGSVIWMAEAPGSKTRYLALFNTTDDEMAVRIDLGLIGVKGRVDVRDLWARKADGVAEGSLLRTLPPHGAGLYRLG